MSKENPKINTPPTDSNWEKEFVEKGAHLEHERWSKWQKYMHSKILPSAHDEIMEIGTEMIKHWNRQINTPYSELSEKEKESDRIEVRTYLPLIRSLIQSEREKVIKKTTGILRQIGSIESDEDMEKVINIIKKAND